MRIATAVMMSVAMLVASPLAFAQRASLADRVAVLEQRAAGDQGATELVNQLGQLRSEVQALRGQIEELQQQLEQAKQGQRSQYLDLDGRLNRLEGGSAAPAATTPEASARAESVAPAPVAPVPSAPPRLFSGYALQAGVFSDPRRAEELQARLMQEGVPVTIESRVQVGPFKTKAEAEAARSKLTALGIETVLLPPKGAKR